MNKLFKKGQTLASKDNLIKKSITNHLSNSVKEIQYSGIDSDLQKADDFSEASNALCIAIEAIFLHGLKDSLSDRFKRAISDVEQRPDPSFWAPLLVISHRQIITQITNLNQITTDVGQCRAWIRIVFNDCLLSSYLTTLCRDSTILKSFYRPTAYIRDAELLDVAQRLVSGLEAFKGFTLPYNTAILNTWQVPSLYLAGIWAPTLKAHPLMACDDVAQLVVDASASASGNASETSSLCSAMSVASLGSASALRQVVKLNEDEALKIILAATDRQRRREDDDEEGDEGEEAAGTDCTGNSLNRKSGWSFDDVVENVAEVDEVSIPGTRNEQKSIEASFDKLIQSYNMFSGPYIKTPDFRDVLQNFDDSHVVTMVITANNNNAQTFSENLVAECVKVEPTSLSAQVGYIAKEKGLDYQNYECLECKKSIDISKRPIIHCAFTGAYFCNSCMAPEAVPIPARIIHNWDFKPYSVSQKAFNYINEIRDHPVIDFKVLNPYIYSIVEEMSHLQILRNQLNFLRAYLYTCREPIIEQLQKQMWPKEYMYEHVHQYSISDLENISNGQLAQHLETVINFGKEHVFGCWLCSQKGFVCEVCEKPKALFPFDILNVYRCDDCNAVYHKGCLNSLKPCPKCKRRKERDESLVGAT